MSGKAMLIALVMIAELIVCHNRRGQKKSYSMEYPVEYLKWSTSKNHILVCSCERKLAINFNVYFGTRHCKTNSEFQLHRWAFIKVNLTAVQTMKTY